jgi:hypothetical protein
MSPPKGTNPGRNALRRFPLEDHRRIQHDQEDDRDDPDEDARAQLVAGVHDESAPTAPEAPPHVRGVGSHPVSG